MSKTRLIFTLYSVLIFVLSCFFPVRISIAHEFDYSQYPAQIRMCARGASQAKTNWYYTDVLIPLGGYNSSIFSGTHDFLLFLNPKLTVTDASTDEENIGVGLRYLSMDPFTEEGFILGGNIFYDSKYSQNKVRHNQAGLGVEFLSKWIDFRSNFYTPLNGIKYVNSWYGFGEKNLLDYIKEEEPLPGYDLEAGLLVPVISSLIETRIYAGKYVYNSELDQAVKGTKTRLEITPSPFFTLNLETKDDKVKGSDVFFGGYISIPFDIPEVLEGRNPFKRLGESLQLGKGARKIQQRMTEPVIRDLDIVTAEKTRTTNVHDLIYVNNTNNSDPLEDGTFSHPHNTLSEAFTDSRYADGVWIFVSKGDETSTGYTGAYTLRDNCVLWGEGYRYLGLAGAGYPIIDGGGAANVITLGKNNTVMGLQIQNGNNGIYGLNPGTVEIRNNIITGIGLGYNSAIALKSNDGNPANITISANTITDNNGNGILLECENFSAMTCVISDNNISNNSNIGIYQIGGTISPAWDTSTISSTILRNTIDNNGHSGIYLHTNWDTNISMAASRNTITNNSFYGIYLEDLGTSVITIDAGKGSLNAEGYNSIHNNNSYDISNQTDLTLTAKNNWWGKSKPSSVTFYGSVDYTPWLTSEP